MRILEPLESRRLLAASPFVAPLTIDMRTPGSPTSVPAIAFVSDNGNGLVTHLLTPDTQSHLTSKGTLVIEGGEDDDVIAVKRIGQLYLIDRGNGTAGYVNASGVKRLLIEADGGDDRVGVDPSVTRPTTIVGGAGDDYLEARLGGGALATLIGGGGNDRLIAATPDTADQHTVLSGGDGNDTLIGNQHTHMTGGRGDDRAILGVLPLDVGTHTIESLMDFVSGVERFTLEAARLVPAAGVVTPHYGIG
jgi:Ca2+-binding RTX toxin-like protein